MRTILLYSLFAFVIVALMFAVLYHSAKERHVAKLKEEMEK